MWIHTCWGLLYKFLELFLKLRVVCLSFLDSQSLISFYEQGNDQFVCLVDANPNLPNLARHRSYANFQLTLKDWEHLTHLKDAIRVCLFPILICLFVLMPL